MDRKILSNNESLKYQLTKDDKSFIDSLKKEGLGYFFEGWAKTSISSQQKVSLDQLYDLQTMFPDQFLDILSELAGIKVSQGYHLGDEGQQAKETIDQLLAIDKSSPKGVMKLLRGMLQGHVPQKYQLNETDKSFIASLKQAGQEHIFEGWASNSISMDQKAILDQLNVLNSSYPGGLVGYVNNALPLLQNAKNGVNPLEGYEPHTPVGVDLSNIDDQFKIFEEKGLANIDKLRFVMVAGGLGERLGYDGIKIAIPVSLLTMKPYIQNYCESIKAYQGLIKERTGKEVYLDLAIMVSNDTEAMTIDILEKNNYFGLKKDHIHLMKQGAVPAMIDNSARFALNKDGFVETKPHGHGDVHMLMYMNKLTKKWLKQGASHALFLQDTNGQVFNAVPSALGVALEHHYDMVSLTVPRAAGEAAGAITLLKHNVTGHAITANVEYNQLNPLLKATGSPEGDVADPMTGYSPFPGNLNVLLFDLEKYDAVLEKTKGIINEFINPKYADEQREKFKSPTRLETMMQDISFSFSEHIGPTAKVGFTNYKRLFVFSPLKNKLSEAADIFQGGKPADGAITAENDMYVYNRYRLRLAGMHVAPPVDRTIKGITFPEGAKVVLAPEFALSSEAMAEKIQGGSVSARSTLIINGKNVKLENLVLDGALIINVHPEAFVTLRDVHVNNDGFEFVELSDSEMMDDSISQDLKIRGYRLVEKAKQVINIKTPGKYVIEGALDGSVITMSQEG